MATRYDYFTEVHWTLFLSIFSAIVSVAAYLTLALAINRSSTNTGALGALNINKVAPAVQSLTVTGTARVNVANITTATISKLNLPNGSVLHDVELVH